MTTALTAEGFAAAATRLADGDGHLAAVISRHGLPDFWHRPPGFATLVLFIVEQQVSLDSARAVFERLSSSLGGVSPRSVASAGHEVLRSVGLTRQKQRYLVGLGEMMLANPSLLDDLADTPDAEARRRLLAITGIGPWTADVYLLSALRRPDVWPVGDRALQVGVGELIGLESPPDSRQLEDIGERWRPYRSVAARLVWHSYLRRRGREEAEVAGLVTRPARPEGLASSP